MQADGTALVDAYLEHVRVDKRLAQRTVELYALDLRKLQDFAAAAGVPIVEKPLLGRALETKVREALAPNA